VAHSHAQQASVFLAGRVVADETGDPLVHTRVVVYNDATPLPAVFTDQEGRFATGPLPPSRYHLTATKAGYTPTTLARLNPPAPDKIQIRLARSASISGRVLDSYGEPLMNAVVNVVAPPGATNLPAGNVKSATTDDLGVYRVGGLSAGTYLLAINQFSIDGSGNVTRTPSYYPGVPSIAAAQPLVLAPGDEKVAVDFSGVAIASQVTDFPPVLLQQLQQVQGSANIRINLNNVNPVAKPPAGTGAIRGRLTRGDGFPIARANVTASILPRPGDAPNMTAPRNAVTDEDGRYEFTDVMRGQYRIRGSKPGFNDAAYGQSAPTDLGTVVDVAEHQTVTRIDFVLPRYSAISGQVLDDFGDPVTGVSMTVWQIRFQAGRRRLFSVGASQSTDDRGQYRIYGMAPGQYLISGEIGQLNQGGAGVDLPGFAPTYFPGTTTVSEARTVGVARSQDVVDVDFALVPLPTVSITGSRIGSDGQPMSGSLVLAQSQRSGAIVSGRAAGSRNTPDGQFEFPNVAPGEYVIQADSGKRSADREGDFASQFVIVNGADVSNVLLQSSPGSSISGRVVFEGDPPTNFRGLGIAPTRADPDRTPLGSGSIALADVRPDLTFAMFGIHGPRRVTVDRVPPGWMLKSVIAAGVDVTDTPLPFGTRDESLSDVIVVLTNQVTQLSVVVTDARGAPPADCTVLIFSSSRDRWYPGSRFFRRSPDGRAVSNFGFMSLPPGDYYVAAVTGMPVLREGADAWQDPEVLESLTSRATRTTLAEGQKLSLNLRVVTP
jgi:protocatechuate 3,4-dioxygenase beta subunit